MSSRFHSNEVGCSFVHVHTTLSPKRGSGLPNSGLGVFGLLKLKRKDATENEITPSQHLSPSLRENFLHIHGFHGFLSISFILSLLFSEFADIFGVDGEEESGDGIEVRTRAVERGESKHAAHVVKRVSHLWWGVIILQTLFYKN